MDHLEGPQQEKNVYSLEETLARREAMPSHAGFYFDVYRAPGTGSVVKMLRMDRPERLRNFDAMTKQMQADHEYCRRQLGTFIPETSMAVVQSESTAASQFVEIQEDLSLAIPLKRFFEEHTKESVLIGVAEQVSTYIDRIETMLNQTGRIPESFDPFGTKHDVVYDEASNRVLLIDTDNVLSVGSVDDYLDWQGRVGAEPELRECMIHHDRVRKKITAARAFLLENQSH